MGTDETLNAIGRFREGLSRRGVRAERMILFGSRVGGVAREDSDIDVVVISADFAGRDIWERIRLMTPAIRDSAAPIEAIAMTPDEWVAGTSRVAEFAAGGRDV